MHRKIAIFLFIILLFSIFALIVNSEQQRNKIKKSADSNKIISLPVSLNSPNTLNTWISYVFRAPIKEITKNNENNSYRLVLDTENTSIPALLIPDGALILKVVETGQIRVDIAELKKGQQVDVFASFDMDKNKWTIGRIIILPDQPSRHTGE